MAEKRFIPTQEQITLGIRTLRTALRRLRWDDQGGYVGYYEGKWQHAGSPRVDETHELQALFDLAGITPDEIISKGSCATCVFARPGGYERGYERPCLSCKRPRMSNWKRAPGARAEYRCLGTNPDYPCRQGQWFEAMAEAPRAPTTCFDCGGRLEQRTIATKESSR